MGLIKATLFTLLTSATAVLGDPACDSSGGAPEADVLRAAEDFKGSDGAFTLYKKNGDTKIGVYGDLYIGGYTDTVDETTSKNVDIGAAIQAMTECKNNESMVAGANTAGGNGDFRMFFHNVNES